MELLGRLLQLAVGSVQLTRPSEGSGHRLPNKAHAGKGVGLNAAVGQRFSVGSLQTNKFFAIAVGIVAQTQARGGGEKSKKRLGVVGDLLDDLLEAFAGLRKSPGLKVGLSKQETAFTRRIRSLNGLLKGGLSFLSLSKVELGTSQSIQ